MTLRTKAHWFGVVLDAPDGPALAHFYADLLGWTIVDMDVAAVRSTLNAGEL